MRTYDQEPTDAELAEFLDPKGRALGLRIVDSTDELIVEPRGVSLWLAAVSLLIPVIGSAGYVMHRKWHGTFEPSDSLPLVLCVITFPLFLGGTHLLNQFICAKGRFCVLDKKKRILSLSRSGEEIRAEQIDCIVEVHGWHTVREKWHGSDSTWMGELSVLVHGNDGKLVHHAVLECASYSVAKVGKMLSDFFQVRHRVLKLNWKTRRRLSAARR
jgi:hypothetical protein